MKLRYKVGLALVLAMCPSLVAHGRSQHPPLKPPLKLKTSRGWISGSLMMKGGFYSSPDGQYCVEVGDSTSPAGEKLIDLYRGRPGHPPDAPHSNLLGHADPGPVWGLVWVPHRPHTLVFASRGDPGYSMLGLWNGGRGVKMLHRVMNDEMDTFKLYAVSRDGSTIIYGWRTDDYDVKLPMRRRSLRLPKE